MDGQSKKIIMVLLVAILFSAIAAQPLNCPTKCGSITIPFPFGTTEGCSLDSTFLINCNQTSSTVQTPFLPQTNLSILNISLKGQLQVAYPVASDCYTDKGKLANRTTWEFNMTYFHVSPSRNNFMVIGCNTIGLVVGTDSKGKNFATGCVSFCNDRRLADIGANGSCSGNGCCQTSIPPGLSDIVYGSETAFNYTRVDFNPCGHAFLVEDGAYNFASTDLLKLEETEFPVVLDWAVGNKTCQEAQKDVSSYACKAHNSECYHAPDRLGYLCNCSQGFRGNPYLLQGCQAYKQTCERSRLTTYKTCQEAQKDVSSYACKADNSDCHNSMNGAGYLCKCSSGFLGNPYLLHGCQDVNECMEFHNCIDGAICNNFPGSYNCSCPEGYEGDGKNDGTRCSPKSNTNSSREIILIIALSVSVSVLTLLGGSFYVYWALKKRKLIKLKEQFFQQNGGLLLQQQIARHRGSTETTKIFTETELKEATNNFDEGRILGQGGQGTVYRGLLLDNRTVAIKKSKINDPNQIEQFINEVIVLSQINHRNVVKLLGCCLETEVPLLVYEFIPNGTVYEHLHDQSQALKLTWKTRLRIAAETAGALAYLHSATSTPIIHRDVKTTNILLDHNITTKVSDFGASRIIPLDKTQLTTLVQGTLGYLDPEYFNTSQLTEKSDVYSFGVVLAELLTGKKALSFDRPESDRNLAVYFAPSMKEGQLLHIVDSHIIDEANVEQLMEVANIAKRCLRVNGEERPTMKEVAMELEGIIIMEKHPWGSATLSSDETESFLKAAPSVFNVEEGVSGSDITSSGFDSMNRISMSLGSGR